MGCATTGGPEIASKTWRLARYTPEPGAAAIDIGGDPFTIHLAEDRHASGRVDCNRWQGRYRLADGELQFTQLGSTRRRCLPPAPALSRSGPGFLGRLQQGGRIEHGAGGWTLTFDDGVVWHFEPQP